MGRAPLRAFLGSRFRKFRPFRLKELGEFRAFRGLKEFREVRASGLRSLGWLLVVGGLC